MYCNAIEDFITTLRENNQVIPDSLFLAKRQGLGVDDFPNITLPEKIQGVGICLIAYDEAHIDHLNDYSEHKPFINLMGWVSPTTAEFVFVCFYPKFQHRYDCYLDYSCKADTYHLDQSSLELLELDAQKQPLQFIIYRHGKIIGKRGVNEKREK